MKVVVQIPCLNEEATLPLVLKNIPKKIPGVDSVEILVIDDGCTDKTIEVAKKLGVKHFVSNGGWKGLARSFHNGVDYALSIGADIVVNTDGDNQYPQERITDLVKPIVDGQAEIVIGDRQTAKIAHFSPLKKLLQRFGSFMVSKAAGVDLPDAPSGFRAYSREALMRINIVTNFSYTMETIIQAGNKRLKIVSVPVKTNPKTRESRLFKNMWQHVFKSGGAIFRSYVMYKPYTVFVSLAAVLFVIGLIPFARYLYLIIMGDPGDHIQSLMLGTIVLIGGFLSLVLGIISDLIRINRTLIEQGLEHIKRDSYKKPHR